MRNLKRMLLIVLIIAVIALIVVGCGNDMKSDSVIPLGVYVNNYDDVSNFMSVYEAWKYNINDLYIQVGIDEYTNTYLLKTLPSAFSTLIKSSNEYDMDVYALLNDKLWVKDGNQSAQEIKNILKYNKKYKDKRFEGINIDVDLNNIDEKGLQLYLNHLKETRKMIDLHNHYSEDNLDLSVNIDNTLLNYKPFIHEVLNLVDEVVLVIKNDENLINAGVKTLSIMDNYENKKVNVMVNFNDTITNSLLYIKNIKEANLEFKQYKSFNGFVISNYEKYMKYMKTTS